MPDVIIPQNSQLLRFKLLWAAAADPNQPVVLVVKRMDAGVISQAIERALEAEGYGTPEIRRDIAFHMTDWLVDLEKWHAYCQSPESLDADQTTELLMSFLAHVPNHMAAASKLMTGIPVMDIFEIGAVAIEEEE